MFGKLNALKQQIEEIKSRLDSIIVEAEAGNSKVKVECTANRHVQNIFSHLNSSKAVKWKNYNTFWYLLSTRPLKRRNQLKKQN
jgi:YbaB/EbfC DNA-binding family